MSSLTFGTHGHHCATRSAATPLNLHETLGDQRLHRSQFGRRFEGHGQPGSDPALDSSVLSIRCMNSCSLCA